MKKIIALILVIVMVTCFAVACTTNGGKETSGTTTTTAPAATTTTTAAATTTTAAPETTTSTQATTTTEATTTTQQTTTTPPVVVVDPATAISDIEFTDGKVTDKCGLLSFKLAGTPTVKATEVTHKSKTYTVDALNITAKGQAAIGTIDSLKTINESAAFFNQDFSFEVFYINRAPSGVQGTICGTDEGGVGLADDNGKPYFIMMVNGKYVSLKPGIEFGKNELVHVIGVYDKTNNIMRIYINGIFMDEVKTNGDFTVVNSSLHNKLVLGADMSGKTNEPSDFQMTNCTIVDAKIYHTALTDSQADAAYKLAVEALGN